MKTESMLRMQNRNDRYKMGLNSLISTKMRNIPFLLAINPTFGIYSTEIKVSPFKDIIVMILTAQCKHGKNPDYP